MTEPRRRRLIGRFSFSSKLEEETTRKLVFALAFATSIHLAAMNLAAATVSGYVHDTSGSAISDAQMTLANTDSGKQQEVWTGADGRYSLPDTAAGSYIFKIKRTGLVTVFRAFTLEAEAVRSRDYTMVAPGNVADIEVATGQSEAAPKQVRIGGQVAQANLVSQVPPTYPITAKQAGVQGSVEMMATISKEGAPIELRVTASPDDDLSEASLDAVCKWRYRPTLLNGDPIQVVTKIVVNFTLQK